MRQNTAQKKKKFLDGYTKSLGNITQASEYAQIHRDTFYRWLEKDERFKKQFEAINIDDIEFEFVHSKFMENIKSKKEASIIFYLKTKGARHGYIDKSVIDHQTKGKALPAPPAIRFIKAHEHTEDNGQG